MRSSFSNGSQVFFNRVGTHCTVFRFHVIQLQQLGLPIAITLGSLASWQGFGGA